MANQIPYNKQYIDKADIKAVTTALKSKLITQGSNVKKFESKISNLCKSKYSLSCINGTAGLDMAFKAAGLKKGDNIIIPSVNFIAAFSMAKKFGANIFLSDVDPITGQMNEEKIWECIKKNNLKKIKIILTMFLGGYPENIEKFFKIKRKFNSLIIEDACHAFGAKYNFNNKNIPVGSCTHSDLCVFSFHPVKTITTGEGGIVTTNNVKFYKKMLLYRNHNIVRNKNYWEYNISDYGMNYRLSDINCALGISQLNKMNKLLKKRRKLYLSYKKFFSNVKDKINFPNYSNKNFPSYHLFLISFNFSKIKGNKDKLIKFLNKKNIFPQFHYKPINFFSINKSLKQKNDISGAAKFYNSSLSLPIFYTLNERDVRKITNIIKDYIK